MYLMEEPNNSNNYEPKSKLPIILLITFICGVIFGLYIYTHPEVSFLSSLLSPSITGRASQSLSLSPSSSQYSVQLTKHTALEKALLVNPEAQLSGDYIIITSEINKTVYNFLKDAYQNPTAQKCARVRTYLNDTPEYTNYTCIQLGNELSDVVRNGFNLYHKGLDSGRINITRTIDEDTNITTPIITISFGAGRVTGGDEYKVGNHSLIFTVVASSSNILNQNTTTEPNNITHLLPSTTTPYNSLVAYYSFDADGYIPNWVAGNSTSNALKFDSTNDYVVVQDSNSLDITNALTISSWVYIDATGVTHIFLSKRTGVTTNYQLWVESSDNKVYFGSNDGSWHTTNSDATLSAGRWYYLTTVYDDTANTVDFYIDGVLSVQKAFASSLTTNSAPLFVGRDGDAGSNILGGKMDELIIWNRTLTSTEINIIYTNQTIGNFTISNRTGMVGEWNFNSTNGMIAYDSTGRNNGTLANFGTAYDFSSNNYDSTYINGGYTAPGIYGDSAYFDGINDYISLSTTDSLLGDNTKNWSVMGWGKTGYISDGSSFNFIYGEGRINAENEAIFLRMSNGTGTINPSLLVRNSAGTTVLLSSSDNITDNRWHHIVATKLNDDYSLYVDGILKMSASSTLGTIDNTKSAIGASGRTAVNNFFNGSIDEVMIFNSSLNSSQVLQIYQNTSQRFNPTGTATIKFQNITYDGNNTINLSVSILENNYGSNVSARIGSWNISQGYNNFNESLVLYYHGDNSANDSSGNNNNGTFNGGTTFGYGVFNNSFVFRGKGSGDYVNLTNGVPSSIQGARNRTISAWFKPRGSNSAEGGGIVVTGTGDTDRTFGLIIQSTGTYTIITWGENYLDTGVDISEGDWKHLVATYNGTTIEAYVNGANVGNKAVALNTGSGFLIGKLFDYTGSTYLVNGSIDEVIIFNKTLSANEIKELYTKGRTANVGVNWTYGAYGNITAPNTNVSLSFTPYATHLLPDFMQSGTPATQFYTPLFGQTITADSFFIQDTPAILYDYVPYTTSQTSTAETSTTSSTFSNLITYNYTAPSASTTNSFAYATLTASRSGGGSNVGEWRILVDGQQLTVNVSRTNTGTDAGMVMIYTTMFQSNSSKNTTITLQHRRESGNQPLTSSNITLVVHGAYDPQRDQALPIANTTINKTITSGTPTLVANANLTKTLAYGNIFVLANVPISKDTSGGRVTYYINVTAPDSSQTKCIPIVRDFTAGSSGSTSSSCMVSATQTGTYQINLWANTTTSGATLTGRINAYDHESLQTNIRDKNLTGLTINATLKQIENKTIIINRTGFGIYGITTFSASTDTANNYALFELRLYNSTGSLVNESIVNQRKFGSTNSYGVSAIQYDAPQNVSIGNYSLQLWARTDTGIVTIGSGSLTGFEVNKVTTQLINSPPTVTLDHPTNGTTTSSSSLYFSAGGNDDTSVSKMGLYIWNSTGSLINNTNQTTFGSLVTGNISYAFPYNGLFKWNYLATDNQGAVSFAPMNYTFIFDNIPPQFTTINEFPADPATYSPGQNYQFNITWTDAQSSIGTVGIEYNRTNYTTANGGIVSIGGGIYRFNITDLPARTSYGYYWWANDSAGNFNLTTAQTYTISQASSSVALTIDGFSTNRTVLSGIAVSLNATRVTGDGPVQLYTQLSLIGQGNPSVDNSTIFTGSGSKNITAFVPATNNYTSSTITRWVDLLSTGGGSICGVSASATRVNATAVVIGASSWDSTGALTTYTLTGLCRDGLNNTITFPTFLNKGTGLYEAFINTAIGGTCQVYAQGESCTTSATSWLSYFGSGTSSSTNRTLYTSYGSKGVVNRGLTTGFGR